MTCPRRRDSVLEARPRPGFGEAGAQLLRRALIRCALVRLDDGSYGSCAVCGREIDEERLEARPEAATCREHADVAVIT